METVLILAVCGAVNILCFAVGARVGQKTAKGEEVKIPTLNPVKAVQESREAREAQKEQDYYETILQNIENYDGTGMGQKDVKR